MYPATIVNIIDQSAIQTRQENVIDNAPIFAAVSSFDMGPEDLRVVKGQEFYDLYGSEMSFAKHGQPAIQAANIIDGGARLLIKRLVADNALLANAVISASLTTKYSLVESTDENAKTIEEIKKMVKEEETPDVPSVTTNRYILPNVLDQNGYVIGASGDGGDESGDIWTPVGASRNFVFGDGLDEDEQPTADEPVDGSDSSDSDSSDDSGSDGSDSFDEETKYMVSGTQVTVKWITNSISNCKTFDEVEEAARALASSPDPEDAVDGDGNVYVTKEYVIPMIVISDNGRGISNKGFRIIPDYTTSNGSSMFYYNIYIYNNSTRLENFVATLDPAGSFNGILYGLNMDSSIQVKVESVAGSYERFMEIISNGTGIDKSTLSTYDLIFMTTQRGSSIDNLVLDPESVDLGADFGIELLNGANGSFGNVPFGTDAWTQAAIDVFDGTYDDAIWDLDQYRIAAVFDANYPEALKNTIAEFVNFREDCVFFRDYGINVGSYNAIIYHSNQISKDYKTRYNSEWFTTYQIYDPVTYVKERVTLMYDLSRALIPHFSDGAYRPIAGEANNAVLPSAIEGTINFVPRITPSVNQKQLIDEARINYAIFMEGICSVQTLYTAQPNYTQLSYINNVTGIQFVIREVRKACPRYRYTFVSGNDFTIHATAVNTVLSIYRQNFAELSLQYVEDDVKAAQKIFYATIAFRFNNWAQTEVFTVYALPTNVGVATYSNSEI